MVNCTLYCALTLLSLTLGNLKFKCMSYFHSGKLFLSVLLEMTYSYDAYAYGVTSDYV